MRSKLAAITAFTPNKRVPFAAQSRDEPLPYSFPAKITSGVFVSAYFIAASKIDICSPSPFLELPLRLGPKNFVTPPSVPGTIKFLIRTFANVRIKNLMVPGTEGGVTKFFGPSRSGSSRNGEGEQMSIFDAAMKYAETNTPLVIFAGNEYGSGSSRDWAAKGTRLLGVKAVIAASFERIHRSNLIGMGVLPLQFLDGTNAQSLGLDGSEKFSIAELSDSIGPGQQVTLTIENANGKKRALPVTLRIDTAIEVEYYRHGGILPFVLRQLLAKQ